MNFLFLPNGVDKVRFSCAYLFRIKVRDKYFLVKDEQGRGTFQPVGGAYKYESTEDIKAFFKKIGVETCSRFRLKNDLDKDLRLIIPRKNAREFAKWYMKEQGRETKRTVYREFQEEVLDKIDFPNEKIFETLTCKYCGIHTETSKGDKSDTLQIRFADIIEIILTDEQKKAFDALMKKHSGLFCFATEAEIYSMGCVDGGNQIPTISDHTKKILEKEEKSRQFKKAKNHKNTYIVEKTNKNCTPHTIDLEKISQADTTKPFTFISYQSDSKREVWNFCQEHKNILENIWLDKKNVGENWSNDVEETLKSTNCKKAILFINKQYIYSSQPCFKEAELIVKKSIPHIIILIDIDSKDIIDIIDVWSHEDTADKGRLKTFKKLFAYDNDTAHINASVFTLNSESTEQILQTIKNLSK